MRAFLTGFGVGITLGFLYAPRRGEQTRQQLTRATSQAAQRARQMVERVPGGRRVMERVRETASAGRERAAGAYEQVASQAAERAGGSSATDVLNTASRDDLIAVPGIGPILADRILQSRPYASDDEVVEKGILTRNALEDARRYFAERKSA